MPLQNNLLFEIQNGIVVVNTVFVKPDTPIMKQSVVAADGITMNVNWTPVSGVSGYIVNYTPSMNGVSSQSFDSTITSASFSGTPGTSYNFTVTSINGDKKSVASSPITIILAPTISSTSVSSTDGKTMTVNWLPVSGVTGYIINYTPSINGFSSQEFESNVTSASFTGIAGTTYTFTFQTKNGSINSFPSTSSQITLLAAPTISSRSVSSTDGLTMTLNWSPVSGQTVTGYIVNYSPSINGVSSTTLGNVTSASFTGIAGTTYSFTVQAINGSINTPASASSQITLLDAPTISSTSVSSTDGVTMTVNWIAISGATQYIVNYSPNINYVSSTTLGNVTTASFTGTAGTTYSFTVQAKIGSINTPASTSSQITLLALPTISSTSVSSTDGVTMTVNWTAISGATQYIVNYSPNINYVSSTTLGNVTTASFTGIAGTTYTFTVQAKNGNINTLASTSSQIILLAAPTIQPITVSSSDGRTMTVSWTTVSAASGYIVKYGTITTPTISGTSTTIYGEPGTTYSFTVQAINGSIYSPSSSESAITLLSVPTAPTLTAIGYIITVSWSSLNNATNYIINCPTNSQSQTITNVNGQQNYSTTFTVTSITTYSFILQVINNTIYSPLSTATQITLLAAPTQTPTIGAISSNTIPLNWNTNASATGYYIICSDNTIPSQTINSVSTLTTNVTGVYGKSYTFTLSYIINNVTSLPSTSSAIATITIPSPTNIQISNSYSNITITWTQTTIPGKTINNTIVCTQGGLGTKNTTSNSILFPGARSGTTYSFTITPSIDSIDGSTTSTPNITPSFSLATGGSITSRTIGSTAYNFHTFTAGNSDNFTVNTDINAYMLVVGSGGSGGKADTINFSSNPAIGGGGGGGGGEVFYTSNSGSYGTVLLNTGTYCVISVGGTTSVNNSGNNTTCTVKKSTNATLISIIAKGGCCGGGASSNIVLGGSGGGATLGGTNGQSTINGYGTNKNTYNSVDSTFSGKCTNLANNGGKSNDTYGEGGGGGGASSVGDFSNIKGGNGGSGYTWIDTNVYGSGGGGGGFYFPNGNILDQGGSGGTNAGNGGGSGNIQAGSGSSNFGGGGGGCCKSTSNSPGTGGSGVVIIAYVV